MAKKRVSKKTTRKKPNVIKKKISKKSKVMKKAGKGVSKRTSKIGFRIPFTRFTFSLAVCLILIGVIYVSASQGITGYAIGAGEGFSDFDLIGWIIVILVIAAIVYFFVLKGKK